MAEKPLALIKEHHMSHGQALLAYKSDEKIWSVLPDDVKARLDNALSRVRISGVLTLPYAMRLAESVEEEIINIIWKKKEEEEAKANSIINMELDLDYENLFENSEQVEGIHADSLSDGLILSLVNLGRVDIEYIATITNNTLQDVIKGLKGSIFQDPYLFEECFYKGWVTKDEYLSGNVYKKLQNAKEANLIYPGLFDDNIKELQKAMPDKLQYGDIYVTLGSPWIPVDYVKKYIALTLNDEYVALTHDPITGSWQITEKANRNSYLSKGKFGPNRINAYDIHDDN
ncbi:MAG: hypothetical protein MJ238_02600, partial [Bacilli bacterium]|nr:hypothetical protein [Bacilli bacterium]